MIKFFTWHDVERFLEERRYSWPKTWNDVRVYSDSIMIYYRPDQKAEEESRQYLKDIFTKNYSSIENKVLVDFTQLYLEVVLEQDEEGVRTKRYYAPLFRDIYFSPEKLNEGLNELPGCRILAFHSYKGGVGRTLSLISFLRECTAQFPNKKILVIDADIEAPGLTWMLENQGSGPISYLDLLSVMNFESVTDDVIIHMAELMRTSTITVTTNKTNKEQFFLPVYRYREQVLDLFASPERILLTQDNKFYITETISKLGRAMGADMVLIDLRAGISEYSAPFLFDSRVEKFYNTSTSLQSIKGTNQILEQIYGKTKSNLLNSKVLMTMIPSTMQEEQIRKIEDQIVKNVEELFDRESATFLRENYIVNIPFEDTLIHIGDFSSLCDSLQGKELTRIMGNIAEEYFAMDEKKAGEFEESRTRESLKRLNEIANDEVTAEGSDSTNMLVTSSIKEIARNFKDVLPRVVISGAKGSGKTYIYKQLLTAKTLGEFERLINGEIGVFGDQTYIAPLVASINAKNLKPLVDDCIDALNSGLGDIRIKSSYVNAAFLHLKKYLEQEKLLTQSEWVEAWNEVILLPFGGMFQSLEALDEFLERNQRRIVFIIDGLEDLFMDAQNKKLDSWKYAIRAICQYVINQLDNLDYGSIGMMVFARKDMLSEAIETNYEQFRNLYFKYELNWNQTEALRLALWLAAKASPELTDGIDILNAVKEVLAERLANLWGLKLGKRDSKEAFSDRWIMAALSDFTGQLQARDIVRFLKYSTESYRDVNLLYQDRLIMPAEIRNAIEPCSRDKIEEIKAEMKHISEILDKFAKMDADKKSLPLTLDKIELTGDQISKLESQGFLKISDKKYYLPEIIRLALGFRYEKGARPRVLSLLVQ